MAINYERDQRRHARLMKELEDLRQENVKLRGQSAATRDILVSTMHEVRRFSGELSSYAESLSRGLKQPAVGAPDRNMELAETIYFTAGLLGARLGFPDIELNPEAV